MPDDLYDQDIFAWSERQSALLRRAAAGERVNDLDWPHIIEEIEDVGGAALRSVHSLLARAIEHLLKLHGWPDSDATEHWRRETRAFLRDAARAFTPGMRQLIDIDELYRLAASAVAEDTMFGRPPGPLPADQPFTLEELLARPPDIGTLLGKLRAADGRDGAANHA